MKILALLLMGVTAWGQYYGGWRPERKSDKSVEVALPAFAGTAQTVTAKLVTLELSDGNTMNFKCTKKTVWLDKDKRVKPAAIKEGDMIVVEGRKAPDGTMDAVYVRLQRPKE